MQTTLHLSLSLSVNSDWIKMAIGKKKLMSSAPWRGEEEATEEFQDAKLKVTKQQPGAESVMHVPRKKKDKSKRHDHDDYDDDSLVEIDPQLRYSFQRNYQVSIFLIFIFVSWFFFFCLPSCENSWFLALNCVSLVTQFLVSWLLALNCVSLVTQLRKLWITWFNLCIFGYPILSFLITCYWLLKVHVFVISSVPFCSVGGFLAVLNCVLIDLSYVLYERLLTCLRINWECELLPVGQCVATLWYLWVKLLKASVLL